MGLSNLFNLIKMKCCIVCVTGMATALSLIFGHNLIHSGITATVALVYGIALMYLVIIGMHEKLCLREEQRARLAAEPARY